jgi:hypothetical protein
VEDFFLNMMQINHTVIPKIVMNSFNKVFPDAINVEWYLNGEIFEAVFHENDLEKIALIDKQGNTIEIKINLPLALIPSVISKIALNHGELMNAIKITTKDTIAYEIIVRDLKLNRYLIEFDEKGLIFNKKLL